MMDLDAVMDEALPEALAIACADVRAGFVIGASARGDAEREAATNAAACAAQLCGGSAFHVSSSWIHAYARVERRPELVIVGVARGDANLALLLDWVKRVAGNLEA
jgi:hypothetical protein